MKALLLAAIFLAIPQLCPELSPYLVMGRLQISRLRSSCLERSTPINSY